MIFFDIISTLFYAYVKFPLGVVPCRLPDRLLALAVKSLLLPFKYSVAKTSPNYRPLAVIVALILAQADLFVKRGC